MLDAGLTDQTEMPAFNICQRAWLFASTEMPAVARRR
jgi:hypothetical protein